MISLRSRLTLAYASVLAVVLIALAVVLTRVAFGLLAQPIMGAVNDAVRTARVIVAEHRDADARTLVALVRAGVRRPGVVVMRPPPGAPHAPPPSADASEQFSLRGLLGVRPQRIDLPDGSDVLIAPDLAMLRNAFSVYYGSLAVSVVLAILLAWLVARWITEQAIRPLITVTGELRRFASGDFTQRPVATGDRSELGELTAAYNGAAAQVVAAFEERAAVEAHMRRFVADAGHELRTPLTVVSGFLDVLQRGGADDPAIRERAFVTLRSETNRMRRLVERLMALARLERGESVSSLEVLDAGEIAAGAVAAVLAARRGDVAVHVGSDDVRVFADRGDLHEAIGNLVDNAVKYGRGSAVSVDVRSERGSVVVRVHDDGPGIPPPDRAHVFERFFRGETAAGTEGSGLGLAIVERAAARCGGTVALDDGARPGTTFVLAIPAASARADAAEPLRLG
jgi:signal transduction histidine kinase